MGLFDALNIGYTGLNSSQTGLTTVGHNISNAENESYTRQRVQFKSQIPQHSTPGDIGRGVLVTTVVRVHDEFVYGRLKDSSQNLEYDSAMKDSLEEIAGYFPDLDNVGIANDLRNYFNSWNDVAANPSDSSQKISLAQNTITLTKSIRESRDKLQTIQEDLNEKIKTDIEEANRLGKSIANINAEIQKVESIEPNRANDLRDQRDKLEMTLSKLLDVSVFKGNMRSDDLYDSNLTDQGVEYNMNVAGHAFVDGSLFHPLEISDQYNGSKFYSIYHVNQDLERKDITENITGGKIGAMLKLRGYEYDSANGKLSGGLVSQQIDDLDTFANTFIENSNRIFAKSAQEDMHSSELKDLNDDTELANYGNIKEGTFDVIVYNSDGDEVAKRTITITDTTKMNDGNDSIIAQFNDNVDDNDDNDSTNDVDDFFEAVYSQNRMTITPKDSSQGYTIAIEDNDTNFAGVTGISKLFSGKDASDINLEIDLQENPTNINAYKAPVEGNNELANEMVEFQYDKVSFKKSDGSSLTESVEEFYKIFTSQIASTTQSANLKYDTSTALYNTVYSEFQSISGVNIDEELMSLMKFQTTYTANAKVITTVDRMLDTLLGIKQ